MATNWHCSILRPSPSSVRALALAGMLLVGLSARAQPTVPSSASVAPASAISPVGATPAPATTAASAVPGEIVVALIEDEATVKRYYPEGDRIRFQPANKDMEPIYVHKSEFKQTMILGRVVGVYRKMM